MDTLPDQATLHVLIALQRSSVLRFCQRRLPENEVEDLVQDVLVWAFEHSDQFTFIGDEGLEASVKAWLFTKTRRTIFDRQRRKRNTSPRKRIPERLLVPLEDSHALDESNPEHLLLRREFLQTLQNDGQIEPGIYQAIIERYGYGVEVYELYHDYGATNVSMNAFRVMLYRQRQKLLRRIAKRSAQREALAA
jgi:DNA-directed RNA polymerase specialized sigma24 family protein